MPNPLLLWATFPFTLTKRSESRDTRRGHRFPQQAGGQAPPTPGLQHWRLTALPASPCPAAAGAQPLYRPEATTHAPHFRPREVGGGSLTRLRRCSPGFRAVQALWV